MTELTNKDEFMGMNEGDVSMKPKPTPRISPTERNWQDLSGFLKRIETVPTQTPRTIYEQIVLVTNAGSTRAYFYEPVAASWRFTQLS